MPCELTDKAVAEITDSNQLNQIDIANGPAPDSQHALRFFYPSYVAAPPIVQSFIGYAIWHPEVNLNGLDCKVPQSEDSCWNDEHGAAFVKAFCYPLLGYVIAYPLLLGLKITWCTTKRERDLNPWRRITPECGTLQNIGWNLQLAENKTVFPPFNNLLNTLAMVFWSAFYAAAYGLVGNWVLHQISDLDTAKDIAITYAIGGAVIPSIVSGIYQIYRILFDGELKVFPDDRYWQHNNAACVFACFTLPLNCYTATVQSCCSKPEVMQAQIVSREQLAAEIYADAESHGYTPLQLPRPSAPPQPPQPSMLRSFGAFIGIMSANPAPSSVEEHEAAVKQPLLRIQGG